ncbi:MAG: SDR family NAD(P)-dependent oxidoreductase [Actinomycetota bacterium]
MVSGRAYLVTGAAGGIGAATASLLVERGASVVVADLDGEGASRVAGELGDRAVAAVCDVTDPDQVSAAVEAGLSAFGRLDGAVCNAGSVTLDAAWDATPEDWGRQLAVNVTGTFVTARAVGQHLRRHGGGAIVNVASNAGKVGYPNMAAYNASKAAVINLTRSLAREWAPEGINVNAVCPGGVDTPMLAGVAEWLGPRLGVEPSDLLEDMGPAQLGRKVRPGEVAAVIAFLLSDDARIIRGQSINVDGGDTPY